MRKQIHKFKNILKFIQNAMYKIFISVFLSIFFFVIILPKPKTNTPNRKLFCEKEERWKKNAEMAKNQRKKIRSAGIFEKNFFWKK